MKVAPKRKRRKKTKNIYFTQVHEDAIIEYVASQCPRRKSELYQTLIGPALSEMVDKIVFTFKFTTLPNIDMLRDECKIWLVTILDKYNKDKYKIQNSRPQKLLLWKGSGGRWYSPWG